MSPRFEDKVVVVTGASRGIGAAIAAAFAREGAQVVGIARSEMDERGLGVSPERPNKFHAVNADLSTATPDSISKIIGGIVSRFGRINVLVTNAGIIRRAPAVDYSQADWDDVLRINLTVPFFLCQSAARWWLTEGGAQKAAPDDRLRIINIASLLSFQGGILVPAYTASKHGIAGITKALANEWSAHRINVNAVAPGYVETENTRPLREDPNRNQAILSRIPQGAWAHASDIAGACLYLASRDADYVNGAILNVDGGWLAR
jgi:2-deoxy-D-gluconate 3-dehydrogenase